MMCFGAVKRLGIAFVGIVLAALWAPSARAQDRGTGGNDQQATTRWHGPHFEMSLLNRGRPMRDWSFNRNPEDPVGENDADLVITNNAKNQANAPYRIIVQSQEMDVRSANQGTYDPDHHADQIEENVRGNSSEWRSVRQVSKQRASGSRFPISREGGTALVLACTPASGGDEIEMRFYCFQSMRNQRIYTIYAVVPKVEDPRQADDPEIRAILGSFSAYRPR